MNHLNLVDACVPPLVHKSRSLSAPLLKSILHVVLAYESQRIPVRALAARAGCDTSTAACALSALRSTKYLLSIQPRPRGPRYYRLNWSLLPPVTEPTALKRGPRSSYRKAP